ncbi:hypothetical protein ACFQBQ_11510 [Granulicella cerasi]|uniref:Uncharacterized protein n=1 Tax=Granulicella cerasi TaxID=741063 RepID=A0ABW1Z9S5_9BACT|nr:hypothetical protein [Granulicella cerasi]
MRKVSEVVSEGFIWGVGITRPREGEQRRAARYISFILAGSIALAVGAFFFLSQRIF